MSTETPIAMTAEVWAAARSPRVEAAREASAAVTVAPVRSTAWPTTPMSVQATSTKTDTAESSRSAPNPSSRPWPVRPGARRRGCDVPFAGVDGTPAGAAGSGERIDSSSTAASRRRASICWSTSHSRTASGPTRRMPHEGHAVAPGVKGAAQAGHATSGALMTASWRDRRRAG